jgi:hypothetical protein
MPWLTTAMIPTMIPMAKIPAATMSMIPSTYFSPGIPSDPVLAMALPMPGQCRHEDGAPGRPGKYMFSLPAIAGIIGPGMALMLGDGMAFRLSR